LDERAFHGDAELLILNILANDFVSLWDKAGPQTEILHKLFGGPKNQRSTISIKIKDQRSKSKAEEEERDRNPWRKSKISFRPF